MKFIVPIFLVVVLLAGGCCKKCDIVPPGLDVSYYEVLAEAADTLLIHSYKEGSNFQSFSMTHEAYNYKQEAPFMFYMSAAEGVEYILQLKGSDKRDTISGIEYNVAKCSRCDDTEYKIPKAFKHNGVYAHGREVRVYP
jgi:hypothetical protein